MNKYRKNLFPSLINICTVALSLRGGKEASLRIVNSFQVLWTSQTEKNRFRRLTKRMSKCWRHCSKQSQQCQSVTGASMKKRWLSIRGIYRWQCPCPCPCPNQLSSMVFTISKTNNQIGDQRHWKIKSHETLSDLKLRVEVYLIGQGSIFTNIKMDSIIPSLLLEIKLQ